METSILAAYVVSVMLLVATPGPVVALVINTSVRQGARQAVFTALGTNWASLVLIAAAVLILSGAMSISRELISAMSLLGCLFIAYIAIDSLRSTTLAAEPDTKTGVGFTASTRRKGATLSCLAKGFAVAISNPKDIIFFVAFFPQFISITNTFSGSVTILTALWIMIDLAILTSYIFFMQHRIATKYQKVISVMSSTTLLVIAVLGFIYTISNW
ncbi:Threonine/homoserine/homoserine lactone efflux protein [Halopseudomonas xinjiangensis]|uniref:Threonine/homoserine/homoserine lactone efflux protein n=1 Tax=Halopseudomonas xinjiangensis TaxID=487184 RepID=A0A1H1QXW8_9GAMM|nr:LysE family translocator [Halopseudomonas xinjiangensis]SDS28411.1 Threonine/homoserine/homoserine lactone efflux protein [Halopseudomonas xinjiangensis]